MIYTVFPYLISDSNIKELEDQGINYTEEVVHIDLSFQDLPTKRIREGWKQEEKKNERAWLNLQLLSKSTPSTQSTLINDSKKREEASVKIEVVNAVVNVESVEAPKPSSDTKEVCVLCLKPLWSTDTTYGGESDKHRALKKVAYEMLQKLGEPNPQYEYAYYDVYSPSLNIIVECGDTRLDKLLEAFFRWFKADLKEFWNLDYPDPEGMAVLTKFKRE